MNNKITLEEFFDSTKELCIHCDTEEKANILLNEFDKMGKAWSLGDSYLSENNWSRHKENTVYYNEGTYGNIENIGYYSNTKIYEFEDVIFEDKTAKYDKDKIAFNNILKTIVAMQKDISQPIYVIVRFWLGEFQGIEDVITDDGNHDLEEIKKIYEDRYAWKDTSFGITEQSFKLIRIDITEILDSHGKEVKQ